MNNEESDERFETDNDGQLSIMATRSTGGKGKVLVGSNASFLSFFFFIVFLSLCSQKCKFRIKLAQGQETTEGCAEERERVISKESLTAQRSGMSVCCWRVCCCRSEVRCGASCFVSFVSFPHNRLSQVSCCIMYHGDAWDADVTYFHFPGAGGVCTKVVGVCLSFFSFSLSSFLDPLSFFPLSSFAFPLSPFLYPPSNPNLTNSLSHPHPQTR